MDEELKPEEQPSELDEKDSGKIDAEKLEKIERKKRELLSRVVSGQIEDIWDRVAYVLNNFDAARNSDADVVWLYWQNFEADKLNGQIASNEQFRSLTKPTSITRVRAKIQNEYKLFQADEKVRRFRGKLQEDKREEALNDKPSGLGIYSVYIDETGKTQDYLSVGSLWVLKYNASTINVHGALMKWKKEKEIDFEFHFAELTKHRVSYFKDFFTKFLSLNPEAGFKLIVVNNKGFSDRNKAITDLTYHLIIKGIEHENESGRAPLPRVLQVWIDEEEKGSDQLKLENIKERIRSQKLQGLYIGDMEAVSSKGNFQIQAIDIFTGAVNRKLHNPEGTNFKDEFADFVLQVIGFDINDINKENVEVDNATLFNLT
jgi:hypothetical protein